MDCSGLSQLTRYAAFSQYKLSRRMPEIKQILPERHRLYATAILTTSSIFITLLCFLLLSPGSTSATVYYFSASGDDSYTTEQAKSPKSPWKTLDRLNHLFPTLTGGDSILFKRGDTFYGSIQVSRSGAVFAPIYIGAYGKGGKPVISGFTTLRAWKLVKPGIYETEVSLKGRNVIINGHQQAMGRYPNKGYLGYESNQENNSITDLQLPSAANWAGAEVVIRKNRWTIDKSRITRQTGGTIFYEAGNKAAPTKGYGYFIQNDIRTLDQIGEWYADEKQNTLSVYLGNNKPEQFRIMTSTATVLVNIANFKHLVFENLIFTGAGSNAFNIVGGNNISLKHLEITYSGAEAILASYSPFLSIANSQIRNSLSGGINLDLGCTNAKVIENHITRVGLAAGMGRSGTGTYEGITAFGDFTAIEQNRIDSIGYNGIYFGGNSSSAKNNFVSYFCLTKDDGAGIYIGDWSKTFNKTVEGNVIAHGIGNKEGAGPYGGLQAEGIYVDDNSQSVTVSHNTVFSCANNGIKVHNAKDIHIAKNTVYNNGVQLRLEQDSYLATSSLLRNNQVQGNIFFSKGESQANASYSSHADDINDFGRVDSNFYNLAELKSLGVSAAVYQNGKNTVKKHNILSWMASSGNDGSSVEIAATSVQFEYNAENKSKIIELGGEYTDVYKNVYHKTLTLAPYTSVVLFRKGGESVLPQDAVSILVAKL